MKRSQLGRIGLPMLIVLALLGAGAAWWYLQKGGKKTVDKVIQEGEKAVDQAGTAVDKSAADTAADLDRRNESIQKKRGFDMAK